MILPKDLEEARLEPPKGVEVFITFSGLVTFAVGLEDGVIMDEYGNLVPFEGNQELYAILHKFVKENLFKK